MQYNEVEDLNDLENSREEMELEDEEFENEKKLKSGRKFGFLAGVLCTLGLVIGAYIGLFTYLKWSGQLLILGENGASKIETDMLLTDEVVDKLDEIYAYMNLYYYEDFEKEELYQALYDGLMDSLNDPYTVYYTKEEYKDLQVSTSGVYYGIGAGLSQDTKTMKVTITKVYRGTPAEEAGLKEDDIILFVEDIDATSISVSDLVQKIRGEEGTKVHMKIYRPSTGETLELDVERRNVVLPSIEGEMLEGGIGYIQITEFQSQTDEQFAEMVKQLSTQGMKGLIVDVRSNPGGMLTSVVNLLDTVLPEGLLVYVEDKYGNRQEYNSDANCINLPIVVLIDENSASASEIFAGALKDYKYATLVGKTTFGKGIVQNIIPLSNGDAIKITTAKYFTPNGNYIHEVGIAPDVEVEYVYTGDKNAAYEKQYDSQFVKALEIMKGKLANE